MMRSEPVVDSPPDVAVPLPRSERVVRRRRSRGQRLGTREWIARRSRRRTIRAVAVCAAALVFMAVGLYLGLARQDAPPGEGTRHAPSKKIG